MRFGAAQRTELRRSARIRVLLHGNALRLRPTADGRAVAALEAAVLHGPTFEIRARRYVVACGGVENARLLLLSNLGNEHDLVGRYFMDHPRAVFGRVRLAPVRDSRTSAAVPVANGKLQLGIGVPHEIRRAEGLLNHYATLESEFSGYAAAGLSVAGQDGEGRAAEGLRGEPLGGGPLTAERHPRDDLSADAQGADAASALSAVLERAERAASPPGRAGAGDRLLLRAASRSGKPRGAGEHARTPSVSRGRSCAGASAPR